MYFSLDIRCEVYYNNHNMEKWLKCKREFEPVKEHHLYCLECWKIETQKQDDNEHLQDIANYSPEYTNENNGLYVYGDNVYEEIEDILNGDTDAWLEYIDAGMNPDIFRKYWLNSRRSDITAPKHNTLIILCQ